MIHFQSDVLSSTCAVNRALAIQQKNIASLEGDEISETCEALLSMTNEGTNIEK